jgi:hypothetical protein
MTVGMGAVCTTLIAGVEAIRKGLAKPIGSLTQMGTIRLGKRTEGNSPLMRDFLPLAKLDDVVFAGWDIFGGNLYDAAKTAHVLDKELLEKIRPYLESIEPMPAAFDQHYVKRLTGTHIKSGKNKRDLAEQIRKDIQAFKKKTDRQVVIWTGDIPEADGGASVAGGVREGDGRRRSGDRSLATVCVGGADRGDRVHQRRAQPDGGLSRDERTVSQDECADCRTGLQDGADADQERSGSGVQGAHAGRERLVLDQHPG